MNIVVSSLCNRYLDVFLTSIESGHNIYVMWEDINETLSDKNKQRVKEVIYYDRRILPFVIDYFKVDEQIKTDMTTFKKVFLYWYFFNEKRINSFYFFDDDVFFWNFPSYDESSSLSIPFDTTLYTALKSSFFTSKYFENFNYIDSDTRPLYFVGNFMFNLNQSQIDMYNSILMEFIPCMNASKNHKSYKYKGPKFFMDSFFLNNFFIRIQDNDNPFFRITDGIILSQSKRLITEKKISLKQKPSNKNFVHYNIIDKHNFLDNFVNSGKGEKL